MKKPQEPKGRRRQSDRHQAERRLSVRGVRRTPPDYRKLARAMIALAEAEAAAQAEHPEAARQNRPHGPSEAA